MNETKTDIKIPHGDKRDITISGLNKKVSKSWHHCNFKFYF